MRNNRNYRMYDGISSAHRLDALMVTDAAGSQIARYVFRYDGAKSRSRRGRRWRTATTRARCCSRRSPSWAPGTRPPIKLPPYRFTNTLADSYRITKILTPAGGEMKIDYEAIPVPDTTWAKHINYDEAYCFRPLASHQAA